MKKFCSMLIILAIVVIGLGFYRGWFTLSSSSPVSGSHNVNVNLTADPDKVKEDAESVKEKAAQLTGKVQAEAKEFGDQVSHKVKSDSK